MKEIYYKGYWMVTNRCNLRCTYCVLENSPNQLRAELSLQDKKELIYHLYHKLNFRRITLSGGEVTIFGKHPPTEFIELLDYMRSFRSQDPHKNLEIEVYTNGAYINESVANKMANIVDQVAVTIDSSNSQFLTTIGRNSQRHKNYYDHIVHVCRLLYEKNINIKLHSVISQKNHKTLPEEVDVILNSLDQVGVHPSFWKFYQYMSYDDPVRDEAHAIPTDTYEIFQKRVQEELKNTSVALHFKSNKEMNSSLFNILSYGNAQYMRGVDSWTTSQRTKDLRSYNSMMDLFSQHDINEALFREFHEISR